MSTEDTSSVQLIHLKVTESLLRALDLCTIEDKITVDFGEKNTLRVATQSKETVFQLEQEKNFGYFAAATTIENENQFLGCIASRFRAQANADTFVQARENIAKEEENYRKHKLKTLEGYEKPTRTRTRCSASAKSRGKLPLSAHLVRMTTSAAKEVTRGPNVKQVTSSKKNSHLSEKSHLPSSTSSKSAGTRVMQASYTNIVTSMSAGLAKRIQLAVEERKKLEERLYRACEEDDAVLRSELIEEVRADLCKLVDSLMNDQLVTGTFPVDAEIDQHTLDQFY